VGVDGSPCEECAKAQRPAILMGIGGGLLLGAVIAYAILKLNG